MDTSKSSKMIAVVRAAVVILVAVGTAYYFFLQNQNVQAAPHASHLTTEESRRRRECVVCSETVLAPDEDNSPCGCVRHKICMEELLKEGQNVCPGCRKRFNSDGASSSSQPRARANASYQGKSQ